MPRFFIDLHDGDQLYRDEEGSDVQEIANARDQAIGLFSELAKAGLRDGEVREFVATVRDHQGSILYRATMTLRGEWLVGSSGQVARQQVCFEAGPD